MREDTATNPASGASALIRLPPRPTRLIGREREVAALHELLLRDDVRLLTITGPPGVGKTRLAVEVASELAEFTHGVRFVDLTTTADAELVMPSIARTVGLDQAGETGPARPPVDRVRDYFLEKTALLILDNFEHVLDAAPAVGHLLAECPHLKIFATSRIALRLQWEHEFTLAPLPVSAAATQDSGGPPAVALFAERAGAVNPGFRLTDQNAGVIADICARMDGLPLAIELAAAQVSVLTLKDLLEQLKQRLLNLKGGPRDLPQRHQTLRAAIAGSYTLLGPAEQAVFRRLSAFTGGFTLQAAEAVCLDQPGQDALELITSLLRQHLLYRHSGEETETRYGMLESLREFGLEQLEAAGETSAVRRRHAEFYLRLAEEARLQLRSRDQERWAARLDHEQDNMWAALRWCVEADQIETALGLAVVLGDFWYPHGRLLEAGAWIERALTKEATVSEQTRARGQWVAGRAAIARGDMIRARAHLENSAALFQRLGDPGGAGAALTALGNGIRDLAGDLELAQQLQTQAVSLARQGDKPGLVSSLFSLGWTLMQQGRYGDARRFFEECVVLSRQIGDRESRSLGLNGLGAVAGYEGDLALTRSLFEERLTLLRESGNVLGKATALVNLGLTSRWQGNLSEAAQRVEESLPLYREYGERRRIAVVQSLLGHIRELQGMLTEAATLYRASLATWMELEESPGLPRTLESITGLATRAKEPEIGARLLGASEALTPPTYYRHPPEQKDYTERVAALSVALGDSRFEAARAAGRTLSANDAISQALSFLERLMAADKRKQDASVRAHLLSRREQEVAALVAQGLSNRDIAKRLFISERTADTHVQHILNKLGFNSRTQIAAWAVQHGLTSPTT